MCDFSRFPTKTALTLALSRWEREPENFESPSPWGIDRRSCVGEAAHSELAGLGCSLLPAGWAN